MNTHNKWITFGITIIISFAHCTIMHGMNELTNTSIHEFSTLLRKGLPQELQDPIVLAQEAIQFLGLSPVTLKDHNSKIVSVAINNDIAAVGTRDCLIKIWDRKTQKYLHTIIPGHIKKRKQTESIIQNLKTYISDITAHEYLQVALYKNMIISVIDECNSMGDCTNTVIEIWDINTGKLLHELANPNIDTVEIDNDKILFVETTDDNANIKILNVQTKKLSHEFHIPTLRPIGIPQNNTWIPLRNNKMVTALEDNTIKVWDLITNEIVHEFKHPSEIQTVEINNNKIIIKSDNNIIIKDIITNEIITLEKDPEDNDIECYDIQNNKLITKSKPNCTYKIWDIDTGTLIFTRPNHCAPIHIINDDLVAIKTINPNAIRAVAINLHDNTITTGPSDDDHLSIWDIKTNECIRTLSNDNIITTNDKFIVTRSFCQTIKIWPLEFIRQGTALDNALEWIIQKTDVAQLNFIQRAYEATISNNDFGINWPQQLGTIHESDSQEQVDGNIYFSFPEFVREYLYNRLNISRVPYHTSEKILNAPCSIQ